MNVSRQQSTASDDAERATGPVPERGPRARTKRLMLETATRLMQAGVTPSVSEGAEAAEGFRATAY
ncbi:TetR/AcrR family transcriptional regulator, partial [Mesorhizobium sp. M7A.F.Ca.CA.004.12.1.1]